MKLRSLASSTSALQLLALLFIDLGFTLYGCGCYIQQQHRSCSYGNFDLFGILFAASVHCLLCHSLLQFTLFSYGCVRGVDRAAAWQPSNEFHCNFLIRVSQVPYNVITLCQPLSCVEVFTAHIKLRAEIHHIQCTCKICQQNYIPQSMIGVFVCVAVVIHFMQ